MDQAVFDIDRRIGDRILGLQKDRDIEEARRLRDRRDRDDLWELIRLLNRLERQDRLRALGYVVQSNGVTARLADQYLSGSAIDQIYTIADAARIGIAIEGKMIALWQNGGARDGVEIDLRPELGMIGYPTFTPTGITCRAEYNPDMLIGRRVKVTSMVPRTSGTWYTQSVRHELSTMMPGGPWWSTIQLSDASLYAAAN